MAFRKNKYEHYSESVVSNNSIYTCCQCSNAICDQMVLKISENYYHSACLTCCECQRELIDNCCYSRDGKIFCKEDFFKKFGSKCSACHYDISSNDVVRRANNHLYHLQCFSCLICHCSVSTGDEFFLMEDQTILCKIDYELLKNKEFDEANKRPRTTITQNQLEILKQAYTLSSKPARYVRESLAAETGLDMRVVQVWFQNRRAKEKRLKKDTNKRWTNKKTSQAKTNKNSTVDDDDDEAFSYDDLSDHESEDSIPYVSQGNNAPTRFPHPSSNDLLSFHSTDYLTR